MRSEPFYGYLFSLVYIVFVFVDGKSLASQHDCRYTEVSASLNHKVDELLVDILKQVRRTESKRRKYLTKLRQDSDDKGHSGCYGKNKNTVMGRILRMPQRISKSCENLITKLEGHT